MAKSTSRPPKKPTPIDESTPFDEPVADMSAAEAPPSAAEAPPPEQTAPEAPAKPNGRPWTGPAKTPKIPTFVQTMNSVPKGDWGPRANIYLYRVEPVIDRTRSGDSKFVNVYAEPISEDRIMADYGSGRYKLILNFRKPGAETGDVIDSTYMDILNMKYPPKIPLGEWTDDPRNKKWAWAKEANGIPTAAASVPSSSGLEAVVDVMRATSEMRRDIREEMQASTPATPPAPVTPVDPWTAAEKILNMRSENPMVAILQQQMKDAATATENERTRAFTAAEAAREREFKLQEKLLEARAAAPVGKSFIDQALELANNSDKLEPLKKLAGFFGFGPGEGTAVRAGRTTGMDILNNLVSGPAGAALAQGLGQLLMAAPAMFQGNPANGQQPMQTPPQVLQPQVQQGPPPPETPEQRINRIGAQVTRQMIGEFFLKGATGEDFAVSMYNFWPEDTVFLQTFGADNLVDRYRKYPQAWAVLSYREAEFITFMQQFCAWQPPADEDGAPAPASDGVEDLEDKEEAKA